MLNEFLQHKLNERKEKGTLRSLSSFEGEIDFISNDFLGLAKEEGPSTGKPASTGSRLISGNTKRIEAIERELANFFNADQALFFNSGYQANLGLFASIPNKNALVLYDKEIHASVRDGLQLCLANSIGFNHNDTQDLERLLRKFRETSDKQLIYVAIEGLYSMSGEIAPLVEINELCKTYKAILVVDEAHSAGIYGENGKGLIAQLGLEKEIPIRVVTFGKAFGAHGAIVLGNNLLREYLINFARPLIYTTGISEREAEHIIENVLKSKDEQRRIRLFELIHSFRTATSSLEAISDEKSPIQVIRADKSALQLLSTRLVKNGIASKLILPPTVSEGKECLRIVIHSFNTESELELLINTINKA